MKASELSKNFENAKKVLHQDSRHKSEQFRKLNHLLTNRIQNLEKEREECFQASVNSIESQCEALTETSVRIDKQTSQWKKIVKSGRARCPDSNDLQKCAENIQKSLNTISLTLDLVQDEQYLAEAEVSPHLANFMTKLQNHQKRKK